MKFKLVKGAFAALVLSLGAYANAAIVTIDFESDSLGAVANGFSSVDAPGVTFTDSSGANLELGDYGSQGDGNSLAVFADDTSFVTIDFGTMISSLSMDFGNDDPSRAGAGDIALLKLFSGAIEVGTASVVLNLDDVMNQTISFSGLMFDSASFGYANSSNAYIDLIEVIDNITFDDAGVNNVPGPSILALFALGIAGLTFRKFTK